MERDFDAGLRRWRNAYSLVLQCGDEVLPGKELDFWYAERWQPGYDSFGRHDLAERMAQGGKHLVVTTDTEGKARIDLSHLDRIDDEHHSIQFVVQFNLDRTDPGYKPYQTCQFESYSWARQDPPL